MFPTMLSTFMSERLPGFNGYRALREWARRYLQGVSSSVYDTRDFAKYISFFHIFFTESVQKLLFH